jgi:hypothetical protein
VPLVGKITRISPWRFDRNGIGWAEEKKFNPKSTDVVVAISPDGGEKYLDTIYCDDWVREKFGENALQTELRANTGVFKYA